MQKTQRNVQKYLISAIALALLSACGGSDNGFVSPEKSGGFVGPGNKELKSAPNQEAGVGLALVNEAVKGSSRTLSAIGQQNSPAVGIIDSNHTGKYDLNDQIRFDQVAFVSRYCLFGECGTAADFVKKHNQEQIEVLEAQKGRLSKAGQNAGSQGQGVPNANQAKIDEIDKQIRALERSLPDDNYYAIVDVAANIATVGGRYVDDQNKPIFDVGLIKIDKERIDGKLVAAGGTIDRQFNGISVIRNAVTGELLPAYMRNATSSGWSYQTFVRYYSTASLRKFKNTRDLIQGYQSIGNPTIEMPKRGWADYNGISHALYNGYQVTMHNKIHADFAKRNLSYNTVGNPYLHTFEKNKLGKVEHIIEQRPDMRLTGEASWGKGQNEFAGTIRAQNGLTGTMKGQFYGNDAKEIGGVFGLQSNGEAQYIGGFGGKR